MPVPRSLRWALRSQRARSCPRCGVIALALARLRVITVPVAIAILLSTFLVPRARWPRERGLPPAAAAFAVVLAAIVLIAGAATALVAAISSEWTTRAGKQYSRRG